MIVFVEGRDLTIFRWHFVIILLVGRPGSSSYHCHFFFHILPCLELTNRILHSVMMCILVLYTFLEDTTSKDIGGFVIFLFFFTKWKPLSNWKMLFIGPLPAARRVLWNRVCPSFHSSVCTSRTFIRIGSSVYWFRTYFWKIWHLKT